MPPYYEMVLLEVCVDSILSAVDAAEAGADRVELCSALSEGGLTPSVGLYKGVRKAIDHSSKTKIFCMIRIRRGDFKYSEEEIEAMVEDVKFFRQEGSDGIVFGCLDDDNKIHVDHCRRLAAAWGNEKPITFHRAFDETSPEDVEENVTALADLGVQRILTSGFKATAELGIENLKNIVKHASAKGIITMPGAGVTKNNAAKIITETGCKEIHASARSPLETSVCKLSMGGGERDSQPLLVCDPIKVKELIEEAKAACL